MLRLKSIDTFRGIAVIAMIWLHLSEWWLSEDSSAFLNIPLVVTQYGFLVSYQFISGVSRYLFYKTGGTRGKSLENLNKQQIKREFVVRGLLLLIVGLLYNSVVAISTSTPSEIWSWFILLAIAFSLIMVTPLLDTSKRTRSFLGIIFLISNYVLLLLLQDFDEQGNFFGILYHILFNPTGLHPILSSFAVFLVGTVVGDILYENYYVEVEKEVTKTSLLIKKLIIPIILIGGALVIFVYIINSFDFLNIPSFYGVVSSLGMSLVLFSIFILIEEYGLVKTKRNYKFFFYFSYYSLTIYLAHNILYFLFFESLNAFSSTLSITLVILLVGLFLKLAHPKFGNSLSIKKFISILAYRIVTKNDDT
ncbi:MAG: heparan-alpha-glucosaminide N-acetyltransferase domain-containing protein [Candidatus Hermodarchaeota archaeon]